MYLTSNNEFHGGLILPKAMPVAMKSQSTKTLDGVSYKANELYISHLELTTFLQCMGKKSHLSLLHPVLLDLFYC